MTYQPDTLALHAGQAPDPTTNARAVPIYATTQLRLQRHAACRGPFRPPRLRQHLHPDHESHERRIREEDRGARGWCGGPGSGEWAGGNNAQRCSTWPVPGTIWSRRRHCTEARTTCSTTPCPSGASRPSSSTSTTWIRSVRPSTAAPVCCSSRPSAIPGSTCPTSRRWPTSPTRPASRSWWTTPSARQAR